MEIIIISIAAFLVAILTFFSGFGLGTILTPLFMIYFPVDLAIALTGVVHFFNNLFKLLLVAKNAHLKVLLKFGIPAVIAAFVGAQLLFVMRDFEPLFTYTLFNKHFVVEPMSFVIAILLIFFGLMDLLPKLKGITFGPDKLALGGLLSGFFGGLSGHQGALRAAFLIRAGLSKEAFIGTGVVISALIDFSRLSVYAQRFDGVSLLENKWLLISATLSAILGAVIGQQLLKKVTLQFLQVVVGVLLIIVAIGLGSGLISN
jgi:uncharacterized protein